MANLDVTRPQIVRDDVGVSSISLLTDNRHVSSDLVRIMNGITEKLYDRGNVTLHKCSDGSYALHVHVFGKGSMVAYEIETYLRGLLGMMPEGGS